MKCIHFARIYRDGTGQGPWCCLACGKLGEGAYEALSYHEVVALFHPKAADHAHH